MNEWILHEVHCQECQTLWLQRAMVIKLGLFWLLFFYLETIGREGTIMLL